MSDAQSNKRTAVLAGVAVLGLVAVALDPGVEDSAVASGTEPGERATGQVAAPLSPGTPVGLGEDEIATRYAVIDAAAAFEVRSFRPPPPPRPERPSRQERRREELRERMEQRHDPNLVELRLTGYVGEGAKRQAVLERRGQPTGALLSAGQELGPLTVLAFEAGGVRVRVKPEEPEEGAEPGEVREQLVALGEELKLPKEVVEDQLRPLAPSEEEGEREGPSRSAAGTTLPEVSADDRAAILERLRQRRERQLNGGE